MAATAALTGSLTRAMRGDARDPLVRSVAMDVTRSAFFKTIDPDRDPVPPPLQHVAFNLSPSMFVRNGGAGDTHDPTLPHRFADLNDVGASVFYTALNAMAHMNGYKGRQMQRRTVDVRCFLEPLYSGSTVAGYRVHFMSFRNAAAAAAAAHAGPTGTGHDAATVEGTASDDEEAGELSADGADEDEVRRKEARLKRRGKVAGGAGRGHLDTFAGGFEASMREADLYQRSIAEIAGPAAKDTRRREFEAVERGVEARLQVQERGLRRALERVLAASTTVAQYNGIMMPYLNADPRRLHMMADGVQLDQGRDFVDERVAVTLNVGTVARPADKRDTYRLYEDKINPEQVLNMITSSVYHTQAIDEQQRNIMSYYNVNEKQFDHVLACHAERTGEDALHAITAPRPPPLAPPSPNRSLGELMEADDPMFGEHGAEAADLDAAHGEEVAADAVSKFHAVSRLFVGAPDRIQYMRAAKISADDWKCFPVVVYELQRHLALPEIVCGATLPLPLGAPAMAGVHSLLDAEYLGCTAGMVRAYDVQRQNADGHSMGHLLTREEALSVFHALVAAEITSLDQAYLARRGDAKRRLLTPALLIEYTSTAAACCARYGSILRECSDYLYALFVARNVEALAGFAARGVLFRQTCAEQFAVYLGAKRGIAPPEGVQRLAKVQEAAEDHAAAERLADEINVHNGGVEAGGGIAADPSPTAGTPLEDLDMAELASRFMPRVSPQIIAADQALLLNLDNSRAYSDLYERVEREGWDRATFQQRLWATVRQLAELADTLFWTGDKIDQPTKKMRDWFRALTPKDRDVEITMPFSTCRPEAQHYMWIYETMASPVLNLAQNTTAMAIAFFASLHHCRWYEKNRDPKNNFLMLGDGASGKSYIIHSLEEIMPPGIQRTFTHMSTHAMHTREIGDGYMYASHEFPDRYMFPDKPGENGSGTGAGGDAINFFKDRLTRGVISVIALEWIENQETKRKERHTDAFDASHQTVTIGGTNASGENMDENLLSRFIIYSVPKPRDIAEGSHPSDRPDSGDIDGQKLARNHFSHRTRLAHQLVRFRYAYSEFMIKCGVLPNAMHAYGGRLLVDSILNHMHEAYSIDTRDPRKRKQTEEMARSIALHYAASMGTGSPIAIHYRLTHPDSAGGRGTRPTSGLWSWEGWLACTVPFMFISKASVIEAITLLESIWSPQYLTRILHTVVFQMINLHELSSSCFHTTYRSAVSGASSSAASNGGDGGGSFFLGDRGSTADDERVVDYNYICVQDKNGTFASLHGRIADACGRYGIRAADVARFLAQLRKQYISTHKLVRINTMAAGTASATASDATKTGNAAIPAAFRLHAAASAMGSGDTTISERLQQLLGEASEMSESSRRVEAIERQLGLLPTPPDSALGVGPTVSSGAQLHVDYDKSAPAVRLPIVKYEYIVPGQPRSGARISISLHYLEDALNFKISQPATLRDARDRYSHTPQPLAPSVRAVTDKERREPGTRWGAAADADYCARMETARRIGDASRDASPIIQSIISVLGNELLEQPPAEDEEAVAFMRQLREAHDAAHAASTNPALRGRASVDHFPLFQFITSIPVGDFIIESRDKRRFPEGRRIPFHDTLRVLPLRPDPTNPNRINRPNYQRLSLFAQEFFNAGSVYDALNGDARVEGAPTGPRSIVSGDYRRRVANAMHGVVVDYDYDWMMATECCDSIGHPGIEVAPIPRLGAWGPVTYATINGLYDTMKAELGLRRKAPLHNNPDTIAREFGVGSETDEGWRFPEEDPAHAVEYPGDGIIARWRAFDFKDEMDSSHSFAHFVSLTDLLRPFNSVGGIFFDTPDAYAARKTAAEARARSALRQPAKRVLGEGLTLPPTAATRPSLNVAVNTQFAALLRTAVGRGAAAVQGRYRDRVPAATSGGTKRAASAAPPTLPANKKARKESPDVPPSAGLVNLFNMMQEGDPSQSQPAAGAEGTAAAFNSSAFADFDD